jgi:hypothetical protein
MKWRSFYALKGTGSRIAASSIVTRGFDMKTVQLAIRDSEYAQSLRNSLLRDGTHRVFLVDRPDMRIDGVVVIDGNKLDALASCGDQSERFVVIASKGSESLSQLWNAGIRHVVFEGDSPGTAQLAIIAAELRLPNPGPKASRVAGPANEKHHTVPRPTLPILNAPSRCGRCSCTSRQKYTFRGF